MNSLDIILIIILFFGSFRGFRRGLILEIIAIASFILSLVIGLELMNEGLFLFKGVSDEFAKILPFLVFVVIFIAVLVLVNYIGRLLKKALDLTPFGILDSISGAILGFVKWAFGLSIIFWVINTINFSLPSNWEQGSIFYPYLVPVAPVVFDYVASLLPFTSDLMESIKDRLPVSQP